MDLKYCFWFVVDWNHGCYGLTIEPNVLCGFLTVQGWHPLCRCCSKVNCDSLSVNSSFIDMLGSLGNWVLWLALQCWTQHRTRDLDLKQKSRTGTGQSTNSAGSRPTSLFPHSERLRGPVCSAPCLHLSCSPSNMAAYCSALTSAATLAPACSVCERYQHFQLKSLCLCLRHLPPMSA